MTSRFCVHDAWVMASKLLEGSDLRGLDDYLIKVGVNSKVRSINKIYNEYFPCEFLMPTFWGCFSLEFREFRISTTFPQQKKVFSFTTAGTKQVFFSLRFKQRISITLYKTTLNSYFLVHTIIRSSRRLIKFRHFLILNIFTVSVNVVYF